MLDQKKIEAALNRSVCGGWDRSFLESIAQQIGKGKELSVKQKQTLGKVLARTSAECQAVHESWEGVYQSDYKEKAIALAMYHIQQPYYKPMAQDILKGLIPERNKFLRMYDNKYSKKVLSQYAVEPKYQVGAYLLPRSTFDSYRDATMPGPEATWATKTGVIKAFRDRGGFVVRVCDEIHSAAKGAKRYKILPIGATIPLIIEERHLKKGRIKK